MRKGPPIRRPSTEPPRVLETTEINFRNLTFPGILMLARAASHGDP